LPDFEKSSKRNSSRKKKEKTRRALTDSKSRFTLFFFSRYKKVKPSLSGGVERAALSRRERSPLGILLLNLRAARGRRRSSSPQKREGERNQGEKAEI